MPHLKILSGKNFLNFLFYLGFEEIRIKGSHHRLKHKDGRITTIPVHGNNDLPKGLIRKIIRNDLKITLEEYNYLIEKWKK